MCFRLTVALLAFCGIAGGCENKPASPTPAAATVTSLVTAGLGLGTLASPQAQSTQPNSCGNFTWTITQATATSVSGTFSATCNGTTTVSGAGTATATLSGTAIRWTGAATASIPGNANCAIALGGTVEVSGNEFRIVYSGTTCLGNVSGTEIIARR